MNIAIAELADGATGLLARRLNRSAVTTSPAEPAREWSDVTDDLLRLRLLEDDWDGQGADAPAPSVVDAALNVANDLRTAGMPPADRAVAGVNGTVFFEWHHPKQYLEIEVFTADRAEGRWVYPDTNAVEEFGLTR